MEVVAATPNGGGVPPFHDHDVREWSRIDSITGALERARLETDHWSANTINSSHKYGKVVDSRARTDADGALQQQARRQLEVFQSQIPGGHLQVIKTHTVSSSRWTNKTPTISDGGGFVSKDFENLQLPLNPLDLSSQKSKATVGRSVSRRPPTRQRPREASSTSSDFHNPLRNAHITAATNLHRVSRLCHQIHETAVRQAFGKRSPRPSIRERQSGDGSVEIYEVESVSSSETKSLNGHTNLSRTKSTSSDDIHVIPEKDSSTKSIEDLEDLEQLQNWRRTSKIRRSLQFPKQNKTATNSKPLDLPENSVSVRKIREDLEKGRRLNTALRNNSVDLEALDQILQSISSSSSIHSDKASDNPDDENDQNANRKQKRNSFVTVESIQEVKGRLRRTSSPTNDIYKVDGKEEDPDDGIVTEDINNKEMPAIEKSVGQSRVRSYVYGMEALLNKNPGLGTGSLESRVKLVNGNTNNRNEDWYNRRKSYGFEQMHNQEESSNSMSFKSKNLVESSTDSGICRSSEIVVVPTATKTGVDFNENNTSCSSDNNSDSKHKYNGFQSSNSSGLGFGKVKQMANTFNQDEKSPMSKTPYDKPWEKFSSYKPADWSNTDTELKSTTITIPIMKNNNIVDLSWNDEPEKDLKRHSIAVDESKYVTKNTNENKFRRTSLALNDQFIKQDDDDINPNRKPKKVEFCKTEVHFAAESGKVNIVATDEKPPPTQNFRRRRRISPQITEDFNKNGLPVLHFGDSSYEKTMFGVIDDLTDVQTDALTSIYENVQSPAPATFGVVTVNTSNNANNEYTEEDKKELMENENIKGILKNKPIKPKPYHLGETMPLVETNSDDENKNWGVRLRPSEKEQTPIWRSTVTVHNYYDKQPKINDDEQPEFQKLLKNLRPTRKSDYASDNENRYSDNFSHIRVMPAVKDNRRSSWSVADKVKTAEEIQSVESRGYSTKVNFGEGEATVVENDGFYDKDRHPTWPRMENSSKDSKQILNKGLVVRIGREDSASNHTVCSKMTTMQDTNNKMTTTKITIDLSPSPPAKPDSCFTYAKYQRSQNHSFKSTSLILNTIKDKNQTKKHADDKTGFSEKMENRIPQQLEALKKLYEDVHSDSDADKEVQLLMSKITEDEINRIEDDNSSVVSGSWSKMRAYKNVSEHFNRLNVKQEALPRRDLKLNTKLEKESAERLNDTPSNADVKKLNPSKYTNSNRSNLSPVVLRKSIPVINRPDLKSAVTTENKLSSPSLVGRNCNNSYDYPKRLEPPQPVHNGRQSPSKEFKNNLDKKLQAKHINDSIVLRQPKKSEMTYFGVNLSPRPVKKISQAVIRKENKLSEKPDLLQHYKKSPSPTRKLKPPNHGTSNTKPRQKSPDIAKENASPIYENLKDQAQKNKYSREFDSSILDELTKAADQILQAVNGYTDEDSHNRYSSDDEATKKKNKQLETISETRSWKQQTAQAKSKPPHTKTKLKHTSSTSSVESISHRRVAPTSVERKPAPVKSATERQRKKTEKSESSTAKANTKARRLQRASSREALLQSHGSSSEDLAANVEMPVRKPRLVKKTKAMQLTVSNGLDIKKLPSSAASKREKESVRSEERILGSLPEIRHKTAVSTIRSTTDKATRERTRHRGEELKTKTPQKRGGTRGTNPSGRMEKEKIKTATLNKETVTHRISTANIKKCHRSDGGPKH